MPEYLSPGVYVQEMPSATRPIEGVGTAMAAFVGFAAAGPANRPVLITNWSQYVNTFGSLEDGGLPNPHIPGAYLSHAVYGYFLNGGGRCYVTRVVGTPAAQEKSTPVQLPSRASKAMPSLIVHAKDNVSQDIQVDVLPPSKTIAAPVQTDGQTTDQPAPTDQSGLELFSLRVRMENVEENYDNLSL